MKKYRKTRSIRNLTQFSVTLSCCLNKGFFSLTFIIHLTVMIQKGHWRSIIINMCHHYIKVVNGVYMFVHDEKLKLKVCLKTYIECTKNNQTLTWRICKIIICSVLGFSEKNFLVCQHYLGLCWYVVLGYAISYKY